MDHDYRGEVARCRVIPVFAEWRALEMLQVGVVLFNHGTEVQAFACHEVADIFYVCVLSGLCCRHWGPSCPAHP